MKSGTVQPDSEPVAENTVVRVSLPKNLAEAKKPSEERKAAWIHHLFEAPRRLRLWLFPLQAEAELAKERLQSGSSPGQPESGFQNGDSG